VTCWGANMLGEIGNNATADAKVPVVVAGVSQAKGIGLGGQHTCTFTDAVPVQCWGNNSDGQLGNNVTGGSSKVPVTTQLTCP